MMSLLRVFSQPDYLHRARRNNDKRIVQPGGEEDGYTSPEPSPHPVTSVPSTSVQSDSFPRLPHSFQEDSLKPSHILLVVIVVGGVLGGLLMWETIGPSPLCGGCYRDNASWCPVTPCPGREALNVETSQINSPTNLTLNIRGLGTMSVGLAAYSVTYNGNQYTKTNWTGPTINTNQVAAVNILIDGSAFTFQSRNTYTIAVTTMRNNIFTFTITA